MYIISTCFSLEKNHVKSASESVVHFRYLLTLLTYVSKEGKLEDLDEQQSELGLHCLWRGFENISADSQIDNIFVTDALQAKLHLSLTPGSEGFLGTKI